MPIAAVVPSAPSIAIDGVDCKPLGASLQSMVITWKPEGPVSFEASFNDWGSADGGPPGFLWSDGRLIKPGARLAVRIGSAEAFSGTVGTLESRLTADAAPVFAVQATSGSSITRVTASRKLRWGSELQRVDSALMLGEPGRATRRVNAEGQGTLALGPAALRPGASVEIVGTGRLFAGSYTLSEVALRFDRARGLRTEVTALSG